MSAHICSRVDFITALKAGVDIIAHIPGLGYEDALGKDAFIITKADAKLCATKKATVITTLSILKYLDKRKKDKNLIKNDIVIPNLKLLLKYHVPVVLGEDQFQLTSKDEALFISSLGLFSNIQLLKLWCEATPGMIFPNRKIGYLKDGYEASFLLLDGNPLKDFLYTTKIVMRFKQGYLISINN